MVSAVTTICSLSRLPSFVGIVIRTRIRARWIGSVEDAWRVLMHSRAWRGAIKGERKAFGSERRGSSQRQSATTRMQASLHALLQGRMRREGCSTYLTLCCLVCLYAESDLCHRLLDHANRVRPLGGWVDALFCDLGRNVLVQVGDVVRPLLLPDLELALLEDLVGRGESEGKKRNVCQLASRAHVSLPPSASLRLSPL